MECYQKVIILLNSATLLSNWNSLKCLNIKNMTSRLISLSWSENKKGQRIGKGKKHTWLTRSSQVIQGLVRNAAGTVKNIKRRLLVYSTHHFWTHSLTATMSIVTRAELANYFRYGFPEKIVFIDGYRVG